MNGDDTDRPEPARPAELSDADLVAAARRGIERLDAVDTDHLASLWDGIAAAAFAGEPVREDPVRSSLGDAPAPAPGAGAGELRSRAGTRPRSMVEVVAARRRRTAASALVGVAAVLLAVIGVSWALTHEPPPAPVATFRMDPLDDRVATGVSGTVLAADDGQSIEVDLDQLPPAPDGSFYELWLLDLDAGRLVSLGPIGDDTSFTVPSAVAATPWPTIDISVEPADGDPAHSSDSVLRGPVVAAGTSD